MGVRKTVRILLPKKFRQKVKEQFHIETVADKQKVIKRQKKLDAKIKKYEQDVIQQISSNEQAKLREYYAGQFDKIQVNNKLILYEVRDGTSFTDSPKSIFNFLINDVKFDSFQHVIIYDKDHLKHFTDINNLSSNIKLVERNTFEYVDALLSAKYLINNSTFNSFFIKKSDQIYVNTWHGTPLKYMGDAYVQDMVNAQNVRRNFLMADYILSPNAFTSRVFLEDYKLNELWQGTILENGLPRNDLSQYQTSEEILERLKIDGLLIDENKPNYIYMPTWQGSDVNDAKDNSHYLIALINYINESNDDFNFLIKVHPFLFKELKDNAELKPYLISNKYDSNEIFKVTDLLITDYSSVFFDFLVTRRPILFLHWDSDIYKNDRGSYIADSELPGPKFKDLESLKKALYSVSDIQEAYADAYEKFVAEYVPHEDHKMIQEYVSAIFEQDHSHIKCVSPTHSKKKILFHAGALMDNGITSSFLNLINQIDYDKYDVTIFLHDSKLKEIRDNWARLHPNARKMFKPGLPVYTISENVHDRMLKNNPFEFNIDTYYPKEAYEREARRLFGNATFDVAVDFSGYSYFWAKYLVALDTQVKICYMHNDLFAETNRKVDGVYPLRNDLLGLFSIYGKFDYLASVSQALNEINKEKLSEYVRPEQMIYINNSINIDRVLNGIDNESAQAYAISKTHQQVFIRSEQEIIAFKHGLEADYDDHFELTLSATQMITKAAELDYYGTNYMYVLIDNRPVGWTESANFMKSSEGFKILSQDVDMHGYLLHDSIYIFNSVEDKIFDYSQKIQVQKYQVVVINCVVNVRGAEYYSIILDGNSYITNKRNIKIIEIDKVTDKNSYLYQPVIAKHFSKFGRIRHVEHGETFDIFKTLTANKSQSYLLPHDVFYEIKDIRFRRNQYFAKIGDATRNIGWIAATNIEFLSQFLPSDVNASCESLMQGDVISLTQDKDEIEVFSDLRTTTKEKLYKGCIAQYHYADKHFAKIGKVYEFKSANRSIYVEADSALICHWLFKNYKVLKDIQVIIRGHQEIINENTHLFVIRQHFEADIQYYDALIDGKFTSFEITPEFKSNLVAYDDQPLIIDEQNYEAFVSLKNKRDIIWERPYDRQAENVKISTTTLLANRVFKTKKIATLYHGLRYVSLYIEDQFVGWINEALINIASYQDYSSEQNLRLPISERLSFFEPIAYDKFRFEPQGNYYKPGNLIEKMEGTPYTRDVIKSIDGMLQLSNGEKWIRVRDENRIIGWILGDKLLDQEATFVMPKVAVTDDFYITDKDFSALLSAKFDQIKLYATIDDIISKNYSLVSISEVSAFKIISCKSGKYFYIENQKFTGFVFEDEFDICETKYLKELSHNITDIVKPTDTVFVTMGRLSPEKNQLALLKATKKLVSKHPDLRILVLGKGPLEKMLSKKIVEFELQNHFFLAGQLSYPFNVIRQSDFFVFPSIWEGQPMVLLETLLLNKKIVSSNLKQSVHVLEDGALGMVAAGDQPDELSIAMDKMMSESHKYAHFDGYNYNQKALGQFYHYINSDNTNA